MESLREQFYASLLKGLAYLKIRYGSLHIEFRRQSGHHHLLISSNYIQGYRVEDFRIIETYRKHLLIYLGKILMSYKVPKLNKEILKPEYVYMIYFPLLISSGRGKGYQRLTQMAIP